jgi:hypothetical protein
VQIDIKQRRGVQIVERRVNRIPGWGGWPGVFESEAVRHLKVHPHLELKLTDAERVHRRSTVVKRGDGPVATLLVLFVWLAR